MPVLDLLQTQLKPKGRAKKEAVRLPTKRSLNLAGGYAKPINWKRAAPALAAVLVAAVLFGKFAVADRLTEMYRETGSAAALQAQLDEGYRRINELEQINEEYAHYTFSGMTEEELGRADRAMILELIEKRVMPRAEVPAWSVRENQLTMSVVAGSLGEVSAIADALKQEPAVSFVSVTNAGNGQQEDPGRVTSSVVVYFTATGEEAQG